MNSVGEYTDIIVSQLQNNGTRLENLEKNMKAASNMSKTLLETLKHIEETNNRKQQKLIEESYIKFNTIISFYQDYLTALKKIDKREQHESFLNELMNELDKINESYPNNEVIQKLYEKVAPLVSFVKKDVNENINTESLSVLG